MKRLAVLGSTGSIGRQTLEVVRKNPQRFKIVSLTAKENYRLLKEQVEEFKPPLAALLDKNKAEILKDQLKWNKVDVLAGEEGIEASAVYPECDMVVNGLVGISGLVPTIKAVEAGKDIALANKEALVAGGHLVMEKAARHNAKILPVDSEHSAVFQCIGQTHRSRVKRIILTASGGPFRGMETEALRKVRAEDALKHPNWSMGKKITIDSATLMNKGLEVIEAKWLFDLEPDEIQVVIHPQSIVHSMVEFIDGSVLAQLGWPDMKIPIQYALTYPERMPADVEVFNPAEAGCLEFYPPDTATFPCIKLAYDALREGGSMPVVLNGANEVAVDMFLKNKLAFTDIPEVVEKVMDMHTTARNPNLDEIMYWDGWSREKAVSIIKGDGAGL